MERSQTSMLVRLCNFLIDSFFIGIIAFIVLTISFRYSSSSPGFSVSRNRILGFVLYFLYYFLCEVTFGSTIGKLFTKTKIADNDTFEKPAAGKVFIRTLCRFIPFEALTIFFNKNNLLWHDIISRTTVIKKT
jgi:uncharacterized RDD family membrane protein YckC